jgi:hypothetical protein
MAIFDQLVKNEMAKGVALGAGVALVVPAVIAAMWPVIKPLARSAIKASLLAYEKGREGIAELNEEFEDLVAETQEELRAERQADIQSGQVGATADKSAAEEISSGDTETEPMEDSRVAAGD